MASSGQVHKFRETFGDAKPPDITRKITACVACRKQKIKCNMKNQREPCVRCKKRGLPCRVNRSLQMLLEDDMAWKDELGSKVEKLTAAMNLAAQKLSLPENIWSAEGCSNQLNPNSTRRESNSDAPAHSPSLPLDETAQSPLWSNANDSDVTPASIPATCVPNVTSQSVSSVLPCSHQGEQDLISSGIVSSEQAEELFNTYHNRLDHYLYRIIGNIDSVATMRKHSPLLTAAICTVASLHHPSLTMPYDRCFQEFIRLSATQVFSRRSNLYDIQAFVIGAFWLKEISWTLIGAAVRIATELQLHRAILRVNDIDKEAYSAARLYYLVYVCDHHFSIAYGRPPLTGEYEAVHSTTQFLECAYADEDDARLISQVNIWSITSQVFETFGTDTSRPTPISMIGQLRRFNIALDTWRADWNERFSSNYHVGNYPYKGVGLHYHFAKLYLCSHAFRGVSKTSSMTYQMPPEMIEIAELAVTSAIYILRTVNTDQEMQIFLNGLPLYFDTMIAFAAVFLLKISTEYAGIVKVDTKETLNLVQQNTVVLEEIGSKMKPQHLLILIGDGVRTLLERCKISESRASLEASNMNNTNTYLEPLQEDSVGSNVDANINWATHGAFPSFGLEYYDLLEPQTQQPYSTSDSWYTGSNFQYNTVDTE